MSIQRKIVLSAVTLPIALLATMPVAAQTSDRADGLRFIPNVHEQFASLTERPEALGFHIDGTPDPSKCKHYQGIVRVDGADGTPFFLLTRSGNSPDQYPGEESGCDAIDSDGERGFGNLVVVRMGSRDKNGERLRSNRLQKGIHVDGTPPPPEDHATTFFTTTQNGLVPGYGDSTAPPRVYAHPGGMQVIGHMLAMAMGTRFFPFFPANPPYQIASSPTLVMFLDVSNPESPVLKSSFAPVDVHGDPLGDIDPIAITALPGGYYLMVVSDGFGGPFYFYRSTIANSAATPNVLASPQLSWELVNATSAPNTEDAHQSLHFFREGSIDGDLYLAGSRGHPVFADHDRIDLYRVVSTTPDFNPRNPSGQLIGVIPDYNSRRITVFQNTGGGPKADLAAAGGFYESPSGELLFYATQHQNEGPQGSGDSATVNAGEWRHIDVVRPNSPTYLPTATVGGPYVVDEGSSVALTGTARPPITKAWIELFSDRNYGGEHFATHYPVIDYDDRDKDDYDHFGTLEFQDFVIEDNFNLSDQASSLKWFAPLGCSIYAVDHIGNVVDETKTLVGDGTVHSDPDLSQVPNDGGSAVCDANGKPDGCVSNIEDEIDAVQYLSNCDAYYSEPIDLRWDLDVNGSYEATGSPVSFNAVNGPAEIIVPVQASPRSGGTAGVASAKVTVRNVAPQLLSSLLLDPAGNQLGTEVSAGLSIALNATFKDPGVLDTQTTVVDWGDGSMESHFDSYADAHGGATGRLVHHHKYAAGTYTLALTVTDNDGAASQITRTVIARPADLSLAMQGPADLNVQVGGEVRLSYTIGVTNAGPGVAAVIAVSDALPGGTQFVSASVNGGVCQGPPPGSGGTVVCSIASMPNGASANMVLVVKMRPGLLGASKVVNTATVSSGSTDPNPANNTASTQTRVVSVLNH